VIYCTKFINSFPGFPCCHCYTVGGAMAHLLKENWISWSKHRQWRSRNKWYQNSL